MSIFTIEDKSLLIDAPDERRFETTSNIDEAIRIMRSIVAEGRAPRITWPLDEAAKDAAVHRKLKDAGFDHILSI